MKLKHLAVATMGLFFGLNEAQADVICSTRAGALSVRSSCRSNETQVNSSVFGGQQGPTGGGVKVFDANGQFIGYPVGYRYNDEFSAYSSPFNQDFLIPQLGAIAQIVQMTMDPTNPAYGPYVRDKLTIYGDFSGMFGLSPFGGISGYYQSNDCSGPQLQLSSSYVEPIQRIGYLGPQYGYLTESLTGLASTIHSMKVKSFQITAPGNIGSSVTVQILPTTNESCSSGPTNYITCQRPGSDFCSKNSLTDPCYVCSRQQLKFPNSSSSVSTYQFHQVTLPFTLPIALPLRYVAP